APTEARTKAANVVIGNSGLLNNMGLDAPYVVISTQYYGNFKTFLNNPGVSFSSRSARHENDRSGIFFFWAPNLKVHSGGCEPMKLLAGDTVSKGDTHA